MSQVVLESAVVHSGPVMRFPKIWPGFCTGEGTVDGMTASRWVDSFAFPPALMGATCFSCSRITRRVGPDPAVIYGTVWWGKIQASQV